MGILLPVVRLPLALLVVLASVSACSTSHGEDSPTVAAPTTTATATSTGPPVMSEAFTPLPCTRGTTAGDEGCAEAAVLRADAAIDRDVAALWAQSADAAARGHLAAAQKAWVAYREAACASEADAFAGGTQAAVVVAQCLARLTQERAADLANQQSLVP